MIISAEAFASSVADVINTNCVVGLSGGADSLCLTMLLDEYLTKHEHKVFACIVDHKLRPESSTEILPIVEILKQRNISCCIKIWNHNQILGNIEQKARTARYELLCNYCKEVGTNILCIAHHMLDQWETFFMRLSRGSGLRGLSSIHFVTIFQDMRIVRPLLNFTPEDLKETLTKRFNIDCYIKDPMNSDPTFERVRWRQSHAKLAEEYDLSMSNVGLSIRRLAQANDCLEAITDKLLSDLFDGQYLKTELFKIQPIEIKIRILNKIVQSLKKNMHTIVSYGLLERMAKILSQTKFSAINFSGLVFRRDKTKHIRVYSELR